MSTWKLLIEDDAGKTIVVPLTRDIITIGRKEGNTIRLTERNVSRFHAKLVRDTSAVFIEDLGSYNGIKLNGDRIRGKVVIQEGDLIEIGDYHLALQAEGLREAPGEPTLDATAKLPHRQGGPSPAAADETDDYVDDGDDEFAGDTQRWEPHSGIEPMQVGMPTVQDQAPLDSAPPHDMATVDETVPMPQARGGSPSPISVLAGAPLPDIDRTTRNPSARDGGPLGAEPTLTEPFAAAPSGSDEGSGDLLPPPGFGPGSVFDVPDDATAPLVPPADLHDHNGGPSLPSGAAHGLPPIRPAASTAPGAQIPPLRSGAGQDARPPPSSSAAPGAGQGGVQGQGSHAPPLRRGPAEDRQVREETEALPRAVGEDGADVPRLVALNTVFAGSVFPLRREEIVVGRVEENDLVIEHRSVSRSHAKLVKDGDAYRILDLKSANGVLLNGEETGQARLKAGDVIELGRVRLRYVPRGEVFRLPPDEIERARLADAQGEDFGEESGTMLTSPSTDRSGTAPSKLSNPNTLLLGAAIAIIVLLLVVIVILLFRGPGASEAAVPEDPRVVAAVDATDGEREAIKREGEGHLEEARVLWEEQADDGNPRAAGALARIDQKIADKARFVDLDAALTNKQWEEVERLADLFADDSTYRQLVDDKIAEAKVSRIDDAARRVEASLDSGDLGGARAALSTLKRAAPTDPRVAQLAKRVDAAAKDESGDDSGGRSPKPRADRKGKDGRGKDPSPRETRAGTDEPAVTSADRLQALRDVDAAKAAVIQGNFDLAFKKALSASRLDPKLPEPHRIIGQYWQKRGSDAKALGAYKRYLSLGGANNSIIQSFLDVNGG